LEADIKRMGFSDPVHATLLLFPFGQLVLFSGFQCRQIFLLEPLSENKKRSGVIGRAEA
jgi:hypothetical protein